MTWKKLLVALDGSPFSDCAARLALFLGGKLGAAVEGIHVVDTAMMDATFIADLSGSVGFQPFLNLTGEMREALRGIGETVVADFRSKLEAAGIAGTARVVEGIVVHELLRASLEADAIFLGTVGVGSKRGKSLGGPFGRAFPQDLDSGRRLPGRGRSVFPSAAPPSTPPNARCGRCPRRGTSRRRWAARSTCSRSRSTPRKSKSGGRRRSRPPARGVKVSFEAATGHPDEEILKRLPAHDLVALGSHGHGRIVEMVLGSTTERVLRRSPVPVLCVP